METANTNEKSGKVIMPDPQGSKWTDTDRQIYHCFLGHMRQIPTSRTEIKILSAIQFTADGLGLSDAHVSKVLVEMGLRASRLAFPLEFLDFADGALMRCGWEIGAPSIAMMDLRDHWLSKGEKLSTLSFRHIRSIVRENFVQTAH